MRKEESPSVPESNVPAVAKYTVRLQDDGRSTVVEAASPSSALGLARIWAKSLTYEPPRDRVEYVVSNAEDKSECAAKVGEHPLPPGHKEYLVSMGNLGDTVISAASDEEALTKAEDWVRGGDWSECQEEEYQSYSISSDESDWECETVVGGLPKPECSQAEHDWQRPHDVVGGMEQNPGVWAGPGAQLRFEEVCANCGM